MSNLSRKSLFLILILVAVLALGAALALSLATDRLDPNGALLGPNQQARAAITAASAFDKAGNGTKYYYTQPNSTANGSVTVNSAASWGSQTNPYVINTTAQWLLFAQVITKQTSGYTGTDKFYILGNDLDFAGNTIPQVGVHSTGFQGTLYGNGHQLSNATISYTTYAANTATYACGLFHQITGGKVYDLNISSTIKLTMKTDINSATSWVHMGSVVACMTGGTIVGCYSNVSISVSQTGTTSQTPCSIGGLVGHIHSGTNSIIKSNHNGNIYYKTSGGNIHLGRDDIEFIGGLVGGIDASITIDQCASTGTMEAVYCGDDIGGLIGRIRNTNAINIYIYLTLSLT